MPRILYVVSTLERSGPTNQLYNLIKYMDRGRFDVHLITLSPEPGDSRWDDYTQLGVPCSSFNLSRFSSLFWGKRCLSQAVEQIGTDLLHTQGIRSDVFSSGIEWDIPKISTVHNFPQLDYPMKRGEVLGRIMAFCHMRSLRGLDMCVGVSEAVAKNLRQKYDLMNVTAIKNGVDTDQFCPVMGGDKKRLRKKLDLPLGADIFVSTGHLSERKDPLYLIERWKKTLYSDQTKHLIFLGDGPLYEKCKKRVNGLDTVHLRGRVENVVDYLQASDYFVSCSKAEGLPNSVMEALSCGLPVIMSDIPPHREIWKLAPEMGFLFERGDRKNFEQCLDQLLRTDYMSMSGEALNVARRSLSAERMAKEYEAVYCDLGETD